MWLRGYLAEHRPVLSTVVIADTVAAGLFLSALRAAAAEVSSRRTVVAVVGRCERSQPAFGDPRQTRSPPSFANCTAAFSATATAVLLAEPTGARINTGNAFGAVLFHGGDEA